MELEATAADRRKPYKGISDGTVLALSQAVEFCIDGP